MMQPVETLVNVPRAIQVFIEDRTYAKVEDVDVLTKIADYLRTLREDARNNPDEEDEQEVLF